MVILKLKKNNFKKTYKGGINSNKNKTNNKNKTVNNKRPTIIHPNNLPRGFPPGKREVLQKYRLMYPDTSRLTEMNRSYFSNINSGFKGAGLISSKPISKYPKLPETPTNRPLIITNNNKLVPPEKNSEEYKKRMNKLVKKFSNARQRTLLNRLLGREMPEPSLNENGFPKSFFTVSNTGFKSKPEF
jgi:hypothetical protein